MDSATVTKLQIGGYIARAAEELTLANRHFEINNLPAIRAGSLPDACREYKAIRDLYERLDDQRKKLGELLEGLNRDTIPTMMEEAQCPSLKVECADGNHYRFVKSQRVSISMPNKEGGMGWLREAGQGGIIQETVNAQTLSAFGKRWIQEEGKDLPAEFFKINTMNIVSVTKA